VTKEDLRYVLERHGFGAFIALILMGVVFGYIPSPLSAIAKHVERDAEREAVLLAVCLNTAHRQAETDRCWSALLSGKVGMRHEP